MTPLVRVLPLLLVAGLILPACASNGPPPAPGAVSVKPAPKPSLGKPGYGTMAPIANPSEDVRSTPRPAHEVEPERAPPPRSETPRVEPRKEPPPPPPPPPPVVKSDVDVKRAAKLRAQGLTRLNSGAVDRAVALLQEAAALDPSSPLIKRDLERALRISKLVHNGK